ncbi:hypothetical protein NO2_0205 [Candidatus Termititenax persephonae]|uniref:Uncharacterized protein n=1 Tax=Candidatus Termititenax persephonae TaxID=2218525 RepID=A0A388TFL0_9BACT|nr:hypothetical protein NO2_0205 [Candidatus Termititenax persephonae]
MPIKIDRAKKYHDCEECKYEFRLEQVEGLAAETPSKPSQDGAKESLLARLKKLQNPG